MNKKVLVAVIGSLSIAAPALSHADDAKPAKAEKAPKKGDKKGHDTKGGEKSCGGDKSCGGGKSCGGKGK
ncbi:MAG TPA: hypothetical protein PKL17_02390 [Pseudomonadota bacterium]|jgi:uncharacterized low-complexity protein|nr:hypothetical protein [Pseudomonadota bacterium]HNF97046.1 hypothetical protein [Pseudomonadota bacterium]HNI59231.1 hypothetical protein [Pseudomonadota bacterium]HNK43603.1 hypothetical protein [Pseudomonadota bacterium]HNN49571.1 hypothetical protein [Pseudomonadota bacterium]